MTSIADRCSQLRRFSYITPSGHFYSITFDNAQDAKGYAVDLWLDDRIEWEDAVVMGEMASIAKPLTA